MNALALDAVMVIAAVFVASTVLTPLVRYAGRRLMIVDKPSARSLHAAPVPRTGGLAILLSAGFGLVLVQQRLEPDLYTMAGATAALGFVGFADDVRTLPSLLRLVVQLVLAAFVLWSTGLTIGDGATDASGVVLLLLFFMSLAWVVGMTNVFNFMDGINGIAALQAIITCAVLAMLFVAAGDTAGAVFAGIIGAAAAGFLPWNYPSGSVFMGDSGSTSFGFVLALLVLRAAEHAGFIAAALVMTPFLLDSGVTLLARLVRGERVWSPHREHFYQRLVAQGWSHAAVAALWASMAAIAAFIAVRMPALDLPGAALSVAAALAIHAVVGAWIIRRSARVQAERSSAR